MGLTGQKKAGLTIDTLAALRESLHSLGTRCKQQMSSTAGVFVRVDEKPGHCPVCNGEQWLVQKSAPRYGKTLAHGQFEARETVYVCAAGCKNATGTLVRAHLQVGGGVDLWVDKTSKSSYAEVRS